MSEEDWQKLFERLDAIEAKIDTSGLKLFAVTPSRQNQAIWVLARDENEALLILAKDMGYPSIDVLKHAHPLARAVEYHFTKPGILPRAYDSV